MTWLFTPDIRYPVQLYFNRSYSTNSIRAPSPIQFSINITNKPKPKRKKKKTERPNFFIPSLSFLSLLRMNGSLPRSSFGIPVNMPNGGNLNGILKKQQQQQQQQTSSNANISTDISTGIHVNQNASSGNLDSVNSNAMGSPRSGIAMVSTAATTATATATAPASTATATTAATGGVGIGIGVSVGVGSNSPTNFPSPSSSQFQNVNMMQVHQRQYQNRDLQQQQRQRMMLMQQQQQRQHQQQQAMQNYETQLYQLLMTLNKRPKRIYNFVETSDAILKKYELYRPSIEFHIYENNYRLCAPSNNRQPQNQQQEKEGIILEKDDETSRSFLEFVARGKIPEAIMDVLRDSNIQFYEGNLILQVYDHTNTVDIYINANPNGQNNNINNNSSNNGNGNGNIHTGRSNSNGVRNGPKHEDTVQLNSGTSPKQNTNTSVVQNERRGPFKRPRVYRTLLRPTSLTHYYDLMTYADQVRFSDSIYQQLEAEILNLTKRNLDLTVQLNPYEYIDALDDQSFIVPQWDETAQKMKFCHREESHLANTKGAVGHISEHEDLPQHTSMFERLMLILNERTLTTTSAAAGATVALAEESSEVPTPTTAVSPGKPSVAGSGLSVDVSVKGNVSSTSLPGVTNSTTGTTATSTTTAAVGSSSASINSNNNKANGNNNNNQTNNGGIGGKNSSNSVNSGTPSSNNGHEPKPFSRLKFIENWRVEIEKRKRQQAMMMANGNMGMVQPFDMKVSMTKPFFSQPQQQPRQQQRKDSASQKKQMGNTNGQNGTNRQNGKRGSAVQGTSNADTVGPDGITKSKTKKPRRTKKAANTTADGQPAPKKKRVAKKKKNDPPGGNNVNVNGTAVSAASTAATPGNVAALGLDNINAGSPDRGIASSTVGSPSFLVTPTINNDITNS